MRLLRSFLAFSALLYLTAALALTPGQRTALFSGIHPLVSYDLTASNTLPAGISYSATSLRTMTDASGFLTYAPNNLYLQSNNTTVSPWVSTGITITTGISDPFGGTSAQQYAYSNINQFVGQPLANTFDGTSNFIWCGWVKAASSGTIHFSDNSGGSFNVSIPVTTSWVFKSASVQAVAAGTRNVGLNSRSGDLSTIQVYGQTFSKVTYETTCRPGDQVITTSSAYYGPAFPYAGGLIQGLRAEPQVTNVDLNNSDFTNASWTKTNVTAAKNQTGPDDVANSASSLTASAANGTACQAITLASSQRLQSTYMKRLSGTGAISLSTDGGSTYTVVTAPAAWGVVAITAQTLANPQTCIKIATNGDSIAVDLAQNEGNSYATSSIYVGSSATTRSADVITPQAPLSTCAAKGPTVISYLNLANNNALAQITYTAGNLPSPLPTGRIYRHINCYPPGTNTSNIHLSMATPANENFAIDERRKAA